jgi:hypothetical protein
MFGIVFSDRFLCIARHCLALSLFIQAFVFIISGALQHKMEENIYQ